MSEPFFSSSALANLLNQILQAVTNLLG